MAIDERFLTTICQQLSRIKRDLEQAEELTRRLQAAGYAVGDVAMDLAGLKDQYERLRQQFPECQL